MHRSLRVALAVAAVGAAGSPAAAQERLVAVERRGGAVVDARPGELVNAVFLLKNLTGRAIPVWTHAELPPGWRWVAGRGDARLAPGASAVHGVAIHVPGDAPAGRYTILYDAVAGWPTGPQSRDTVVVAVAAIRALSLELAEAPRFVGAGESFEVRYLLRNRGNVRSRVDLDVAGNRPFDARLDSAGVTLEPGEGRVIRVSVATDARHRVSSRQSVMLRARAADAEEGGAGRAEPRGAGGDAAGAVTAAAAAVVEVIAAGGAAAPEPHAFPLRLAVRGGRPAGSVPPVELSGRGPLTRDGGVRLDVLLRGPETGNSSLFGDRDEYRVELRGRGFAFGLGDRVYDARLLTQPARYGFGGGGDVSWGGLELGGFVFGDRRYAAGSGQRAGFIGYRHGESGLRLHYGETTGAGAGRTWSGQGVLAPVRGASLVAEYGAAGTAAGTPRPDARAFELRAARSRVALGARHMRVDAGYPSQYRGVSQDYAAVSVGPWRGFRVGGWLNRTERSFAPAARQRVRTEAVDMGYGRFATLMLRSTRRTGDYTGSPYDWRERSARLRLGAELLGVHVAPEVEVGRTDDLLGGTTSDLRRYVLRASAGFAGGSYSAWVDRFSGRTAFLAAPQARVSAGAQASVRLGASTRLRFSLATRRHDGSRRWGPTVIDAGIEQGLPFGHSITSRARSVASGRAAEELRTDAVVEYAIPFEVPIPGGAAGRVMGRIYDAETGAGLAGVPVRLGGRTLLTDAQGGVEFAGVEPGTHRLTLDRLASGIDRVPLVDLPLALEVGGAEPVRVEIGLVRGARLSGTIRRFAFEEALRQDQTPELADAGGLANVLVELSREGEVHRRLTDARGAFDFGNLRPGRWTIEVRAADLPPRHDLEVPQRVIELEPGDVERLRLRVVPARREIRIVDRAEVVAEPAAGEKARAAGAPRAERRAAARTYAVGPDDAGLMDVARKVYGDASLWPKIWLANRAEIQDPDLIRSGQTLAIPPAGPLAPEEARAKEAYYRSRPAPRNTYVVREGDRSLAQVARDVYGDAALWPKLWVANRNEVPDPDRIRPGQVLYVPARAPLTAEEQEALRQYRARGGG